MLALLNVLGIVILLGWIVACLGMVIDGCTTILAPVARPDPDLLLTGSILGSAVVLLGLPCIWTAAMLSPVGLLFALIPFGPAAAAIFRAARTTRDGAASRTAARRARWIAIGLVALVAMLIHAAVDRRPWAGALALGASGLGLVALVVGTIRLPRCLHSMRGVDVARRLIRWTMCVSVPPVALVWLFFGISRRQPQVEDLAWLTFSPFTLPLLATIAGFCLALALRVRRMQILEEEDDDDERRPRAPASAPTGSREGEPEHPDVSR